MAATSKKSRTQFACIHHGTKTENWRELENYVNKDAEVGKQGSGVLAGRLGITRDVHSLVPDKPPECR